jgi:hypothetical protein
LEIGCSPRGGEYARGMRGFMLAAFLTFVGCSRSHLVAGQHRDGQAPPPADDAAADALPATGQIDATDRMPAADSFPAADDSSTCTPLQATALADPDYGACPATADTAACVASDIGAGVARSADCIASWGAIPFQCSNWPVLPAGQEFVVLTVSDCSFTIFIESAVACADHIEISYIEEGHCTSCDSMHSTMRAFSLPLDSRPVIASGRSIMPPCIPP